MEGHKWLVGFLKVAFMLRPIRFINQDPPEIGIPIHDQAPVEGGRQFRDWLVQQGPHFKVLKASIGLELLNGGDVALQAILDGAHRSTGGFQGPGLHFAIVGFQLREFLRLPQEQQILEV